MQRIVLKSKLHGLRITRTVMEYEGSITLDPLLLAAANLLPFEQVHVLNLNTGTRLETYAIEGRKGSGQVELNGPAARLGQRGDRVIVLAYGLVPDGERPRPRVVLVTPRNRVRRILRKSG